MAENATHTGWTFRELARASRSTPRNVGKAPLPSLGLGFLMDGRWKLSVIVLVPTATVWKSPDPLDWSRESCFGMG